MKGRRLAAWVACSIAVVALAGCGYALAGHGNTLPATIKTIAVPAFINQSPVPDIDRVVTEAVTTEFQGRGKYLVQADRAGADAVLTGTITNVTLLPASFTQQGQANNVTLIVTVNAEFRDLLADKVIWSNPSLQFREEYPLTTSTKPNDANALFNQNAPALDRLAKDLAKNIVTEIFQAF